MSKLDEIKVILSKYEQEMTKLIAEAKREGFEEGLVQTSKLPSDAQFRKDHKDVVTYGEDLAMVVYARSRKTAAKLLECEEDYVEDIGVGWGVYDFDGEMTVGYVVGLNVIPKWEAYGVWL